VLRFMGRRWRILRGTSHLLRARIILFTTVRYTVQGSVLFVEGTSFTYTSMDTKIQLRYSNKRHVGKKVSVHIADYYK
jgi:hypothetical protein